MEAIAKKPVADVFGITDPGFSKAIVKVFAPSADTPKATQGFVFQLESLRRLVVWAASASLPAGHFKATMKRNLMIFGPTGCGKTQLLREFCSRTGRSLFRFQCNEDTEPSALFGTWKLCRPIVKEEPAEDAGLIEKGIAGIARSIERLALALKKSTGLGPEMTFVYGPVLRWATTPNSVLLLDEMDQLLPSVAMSLNAVLDGDDSVVPETGERITPAAGCLVAATGNTNGRGSAGGNGGTATLYKGVKRQNIATLDRFFVINATYLTEEEEVKLLMDQCKVNGAVAQAMAKLAAQIRKRFLGLNEDAGANGAPLEFTITTRNLLNWAMSFWVLQQLGMTNREALDESLSFSLLDFGSKDERQAILDAFNAVLGDV